MLKENTSDTNLLDNLQNFSFQLNQIAEICLDEVSWLSNEDMNITFSKKDIELSNQKLKQFENQYLELKQFENQYLEILKTFSDQRNRDETSSETPSAGNDNNESGINRMNQLRIGSS